MFQMFQGVWQVGELTVFGGCGVWLASATLLIFCVFFGNSFRDFFGMISFPGLWILMQIRENFYEAYYSILPKMVIWMISRCFPHVLFDPQRFDEPNCPQVVREVRPAEPGQHGREVGSLHAGGDQTRLLGAAFVLKKRPKLNVRWGKRRMNTSNI